MAFLDILNIPSLLGREVPTFKRATVYDKLDLGLALTVGLLASLVCVLSGLSAPLKCVPASCESSNTHPNCALDWTFQSELCRSEASSVPDASFHYVLAVLALLLLGILTVPVYWGSQSTKVIYKHTQSLTKHLIFRNCLKTFITSGQN